MSAVQIVAAAGGSAVETVGAYAGLAAIIGLAVLSLLYFSQAREVKRLREWAGRAPERATDLEQRVQTDAQRRVVAQPMAPATIAAQNDAARQAAAAAALYAKVGATPPPAPGVGPPGQLARPVVPVVAGVPPTPAPAATVLTPAPGSVPNALPVTPGAATPGLGSAPAPVPAPAPVVSAPPSLPPARTPMPATAAARQTIVASRTASPHVGSNGGGQDTHESDAARPAPLPLAPARPPESPAYDDDDDGGFSGARIGAIVAGAVVVVVIAIVAMSSLTGEAPKPEPNGFGTTTPAVPEETATGASAAPSEPRAAARVDRGATKISVLNGTNQAGLAREVADKLGQGGFTIGAVGNNDDQQVPQTIVSYTEGNERAAQVVAGLIKVDRGSVQALDASASAASDADADVVVTVGTDQIG